MNIDFDNVRDQIESWEDRLEKWDGVIKVADTTILDTEKALAKADEALEIAELKYEENKHLLPKVAIGVLVVGVAVGALIALKKRRKAANQWEILEQPEDVKAPTFEDVKAKAAEVKDVAADKADEVKDAAADKAEEAQDAAADKADEVKDAAAVKADEVKDATEK